MRRLLTPLLALVLSSFALAAPERWAEAIKKFTDADATNPPPRNGIVFIGSSSIGRWDSLEGDFAGLPVIKRGFGGSHLTDSVYYADRIVIPYAPKTVVVYAGENDLASGKSPEEVHAAFKEFVAKVHASLPQTRIVFIAMKPSPKRWGLKEKFLRGNQLIAAACADDRRLAFVDIWQPMLGANGEPRPELFVPDMLHMNEAGYAIWVKAIAPLLKS